MFKRKYKLVSPRMFIETMEELTVNENEVIIRPTHYSICAADIRYYSGDRDEKTLKEKLPLTLIHESIGRVVYDKSGEFPAGTSVVLIPNAPQRILELYKENYDRTSKFASSSTDGFLQDLLVLPKSRIIDVSDINPLAAVMSELMSVIFNAFDDLPTKVFQNNNNIGIWGNGNIGYLLSIILKELYPNLNVYVFGKQKEKNKMFLRADNTYIVDNIPNDVIIDHAFECVGGNASEVAINQIIDIIQPQGCISLLGVSERSPKLNTRMILEKGLSLFGSSRSGYRDFKQAVELLRTSDDVQNQVRMLVTELISVETVADITDAFDKSMVTDFKTVMVNNL